MRHVWLSNDTSRCAIRISLCPIFIPFKRKDSSHPAFCGTVVSDSPFVQVLANDTEPFKVTGYLVVAEIAPAKKERCELSVPAGKFLNRYHLGPSDDLETMYAEVESTAWKLGMNIKPEFSSILCAGAVDEGSSGLDAPSIYNTAGSASASVSSCTAIPHCIGSACPEFTTSKIVGKIVHLNICFSLNDRRI